MRADAKPHEVAQILAKAGGICDRCGARSPALAAVERTPGELAPQCLNRRACNRRARALAAAEDEGQR